MSFIQQNYSSADTLDDLNALMYVIRSQIENGVNTVEIVRILKKNDNGTVDVIPVIKNISASKEPIDETPIYGVRYMRFQYGKNAITVEPEEGDVGLLLVCKKDISAYDSGMVPSRIKFNLSSGVYIGGLLGANETPTQFIHFEDDKIDIVGTGTININAPTVNITADEAVIEAETSTIKSTTSTIEATTINLGGEGGKAVARAGDNVVAGTTVIGQIQSGSSKVFAVD